MEETDEQRIERIKRTGNFVDSKDMLVWVRQTSDLTKEEIDSLLSSVASGSE